MFSGYANRLLLISNIVRLVAPLIDAMPCKTFVIVVEATSSSNVGPPRPRKLLPRSHAAVTYARLPSVEKPATPGKSLATNGNAAVSDW